MKELRFTSQAEAAVGVEARKWLASINAMILSQGLALEAAKGIFDNRHALSIDDESLAEVTRELAIHYGFDASEAMGKLRLDLEKDIKSALMFEQFDVDPFMAITEYKADNWIEKLAPYSRYIEPREPIRFSTFAKACKAAVVSTKATELSQEADTERDRILTMPTQEWDEYRSGIRWSQSGRAEDVYRSLMYVVKQVYAITNPIDGLFFVKQDKNAEMLDNLFMPLQTAQALNQNSQLVDIKPTDFTIRNRHIHLDNVLKLKPKNS